MKPKLLDKISYDYICEDEIIKVIYLYFNIVPAQTCLLYLELIGNNLLQQRENSVLHGCTHRETHLADLYLCLNLLLCIILS
ncbi:hypothetical protein V1477_009618 [Vespula maculifrons]|uniref:Uncharacterized protein n=1 Tax=Vespula maculifrons TaxID=7453 RepID=A0ABD2CB64_VESMC